MIEPFRSCHRLVRPGEVGAVMVERVVEVGIIVEDGGKELTSGDSRMSTKLLVGTLLLSKQWERESFFLGQRLRGFSHI